MVDALAILAIVGDSVSLQYQPLLIHYTPLVWGVYRLTKKNKFAVFDIQDLEFRIAVTHTGCQS